MTLNNSHPQMDSSFKLNCNLQTCQSKTTMAKKQQQQRHTGGILNPMVAIGIRNLIKRRRRRKRNGSGIIPLQNIIPYHMPWWISAGRF